MKVEEYSALDAVAIAQLVRDGEIPAPEVTEAALAAVDRLNPRLNAVVMRSDDRAREAARTLPRDLPLAGVPFLIKDYDLATEEWPTTHSSRFFADSPPRRDSEIVRRWRAAGTVFLGKTNTPEFADDFVTEPLFRGVTLNPWDPRSTVGGSSGGAAAAVASGMVPVASGSDVGGSIRVPAACCGIFGLKPSRGLNPGGPYVIEAGGGLNSNHVLSRTVRDSAAFLDVTAGPESGAPYRVDRSVPSYLSALDTSPDRLRIGCISSRPDGTAIDPEIAARLADAERMLVCLGHEVLPATFPAEIVRLGAGDGWMALWLIDIALAIRDRSRELGRPPRPGEIEALPRFVMHRAEALSALDYMEARRTAHSVIRVMHEALGAYDILLMPATATLPPPVGSIDSRSEPFDYRRWIEVAYGFAPFSEIFNVTGQPAASLPLFRSATGVPIGMQIVGRQNEDHVVLSLAAQLERLTSWPSQHPPIWAGRA